MIISFNNRVILTCFKIFFEPISIYSVSFPFDVSLFALITMSRRSGFPSLIYFGFQLESLQLQLNSYLQQTWLARLFLNYLASHLYKLKIIMTRSLILQVCSMKHGGLITNNLLFIFVSCC